MKYSGKVFPIERYIIAAVRKRREELGITQEKLSLELDLNTAFVGWVETPSRREKYNINHLNKLAEILKCSITDFMPTPFLTDNI